ncbi:MAG: LytTR family DNA-binding domain-containing protein [Bacteroidota bacterium]
MEVVIIEDEELASDKLVMLLSQIDREIEVKKVLKSVEESVRWLSVNDADLLFLDINLSDDLSFHIFNEVQVDIPVIFTTAYDEYAIKAFEQNSIAYLLKPIDKDELRKSLDKYRRLHQSKGAGFGQLLAQIQGLKSKEPKSRITVNYGGKMRSIAVKDIAVFYIQERTLYLKTFSSTKYVVDDTLDNLSNELSKNFFRVNRKFLINIDAIEEVIPFSSRKLKVGMNIDVPELVLVPTEKITAFKNWFNGVT